MRELTEDEIEQVSRGPAAGAPPARRSFVFPLSDAARARIEQDRREALRLYGLGNAWLAREILSAARAAQAAYPRAPLRSSPSTRPGRRSISERPTTPLDGEDAPRPVSRDGP